MLFRSHPGHPGRNFPKMAEVFDKGRARSGSQRGRDNLDSGSYDLVEDPVNPSQPVGCGLPRRPLSQAVAIGCVPAMEPPKVRPREATGPVKGLDPDEVRPDRVLPEHRKKLRKNHRTPALQTAYHA